MKKAQQGTVGQIWTQSAELAYFQANMFLRSAAKRPNTVSFTASMGSPQNQTNYYKQFYICLFKVAQITLLLMRVIAYISTTFKSGCKEYGKSNKWKLRDIKVVSVKILDCLFSLVSTWAAVKVAIVVILIISMYQIVMREQCGCWEWWTRW